MTGRLVSCAKKVFANWNLSKTLVVCYSGDENWAGDRRSASCGHFEHFDEQLELL